MPDVTVIVPLRSFAAAKSRLRAQPGLDVDTVVERLAGAVLDAARPRRVVVATDDPGVGEWARERGADVVETPPGLNPSVEAAVASLAPGGGFAVVAHGDLIDPTGLGTFSPSAGVTIVADHRGTGTNVLAVPVDAGFRFRFGPDSRRHHEREALRLGLSWRTVTDSPWRYDLDEPSDLGRVVP